MSSIEAWRPAYYPNDPIRPMPPFSGAAPRLVDTPMLTADQLTLCGLEAWLGYQALRKSGCTDCVQCANPSGEVILDFYLTESQNQDGMCIGVNWFAVRYLGPDTQRRVPWATASGQPLDGVLGTGNRIADFKSLHYRCTDGRIMTRSGVVAPAPPGTTFGDHGALVNPSGVAIHSNVQVPPNHGGNQVALVVWAPENNNNCRSDEARIGQT